MSGLRGTAPVGAAPPEAPWHAASASAPSAAAAARAGEALRCNVDAGFMTQSIIARRWRVLLAATLFARGSAAFGVRVSAGLGGDVAAEAGGWRLAACRPAVSLAAG